MQARNAHRWAKAGMTPTRSGEADDYHERLIASLRGYSDSERAEKDRIYHKSRWEHWGVTAPAMEAAIRETLDGAGPDTLMQISRDLWPEPVWDLKIVAARILARKSVPPDERLWDFVTARMGDLDAWAVADNMSSVASRCLIADPHRLDAVETWVESGHLWTRRASLHCRGPDRDAIPNGCSAGRGVFATIANGSFRRRSAGGSGNSASAIRIASGASSPSTAGG